MEPGVAVNRTCSGCGARIELPPDRASGTCSYCGSQLVDSERAEAQFDRIAPFRVERRAAAQALKEFLAGRLWAPRAVRRTSVHAQRLRGVLVPFWVYQGIVRSEYTARVGVYWYRTETYTDSKGNVRTRTVRETEWFHLSGTAIRAVEDHIVSASIGLPESESNALEPFDLGWALDMDPRLLSGWETELPSVDRATADQTAANELRDLEASRIQASLLPGNVNRVKQIGSKVDVEDRDIALLPVWITTYKHADKTFRLLVNGQTGKCVGQVPTSVGKIVALVGAILLLIVIALFLTGVIPWPI